MKNPSPKQQLTTDCIFALVGLILIAVGSRWGYLIFNLGPIGIWVIISSVLHEFGHVLAAHLLGGKDIQVFIGMKPSARSETTKRTPITFALDDWGGATSVRPGGLLTYRGGLVIFAAAGPAVNLVIVILALHPQLTGTPWKQLLISAGEHFDPTLVIVTCNLLSLVSNMLVPNPFSKYLQLDSQKERTDGELIWSQAARPLHKLELDQIQTALELAKVGNFKKALETLTTLNESNIVIDFTAFQSNGVDLAALFASWAVITCDLKRFSEWYPRSRLDDQVPADNEDRRELILVGLGIQGAKTLKNVATEAAALEMLWWVLDQVKNTAHAQLVFNEMCLIPQFAEDLKLQRQATKILLAGNPKDRAWIERVARGLMIDEQMYLVRDDLMAGRYSSALSNLPTISALEEFSELSNLISERALYEGSALGGCGRYQEAEAILRKLLTTPNQRPEVIAIARCDLVMILLYQERIDEAANELAKLDSEWEEKLRFPRIAGAYIALTQNKVRDASNVLDIDAADLMSNGGRAVLKTVQSFVKDRLDCTEEATQLRKESLALAPEHAWVRKHCLR